MQECVLTVLNMLEYARILNVFDAVHSIRSLCKLQSSYRERHVQDTVIHLRWSVLQKNYAWVQARSQYFSGLVECG